MENNFKISSNGIFDKILGNYRLRDALSTIVAWNLKEHLESLSVVGNNMEFRRTSCQRKPQGEQMKN